MAWELPSTFKRASTTNTPHKLIFDIKFSKAENFD